MPAYQYFRNADRETLAQVRARYRELAKEFHPDHAGKAYTRVFQDIVDEYERAAKEARQREAGTYRAQWESQTWEDFERARKAQHYAQAEEAARQAEEAARAAEADYQAAGYRETCAGCGKRWEPGSETAWGESPNAPEGSHYGRPRKFCSDACRQKAYRERQRRARQQRRR